MRQMNGGRPASKVVPCLLRTYSGQVQDFKTFNTFALRPNKKCTWRSPHHISQPLKMTGKHASRTRHEHKRYTQIKAHKKRAAVYSARSVALELQFYISTTAVNNLNTHKRLQSITQSTLSPGSRWGHFTATGAAGGCSRGACGTGAAPRAPPPAPACAPLAPP